MAKQFHTIHLRFDAASAVVSTPASPQIAAKISLRADRIVSGNSSGTRPWPGRRLCSNLPRGGGDNVYVLIWKDLVQGFGQHGSITDAAAGDLDCPNLHRFRVDAYVYLAPYAAFAAAMFARMPLAFIFCFDPRVVDEEIQ